MKTSFWFKNILIWGIIFYCPFMLYAQNFKISGKVYSSTEKTELGSATILLYNANDTTTLIKGSISDNMGNYILSNLSAGNYRIKVSNMGYIQQTDTVCINNNIVKDFYLLENVNELAEITIEGQLSYQESNKRIETFTQQQVKSSQNALDLASQIPQLYLDPLEKNLKDRSGASLTLLINGIVAESNELRNIPPEKIVRIEYYDIPPLRYSFNGRVANVITKRLDTGYNGGIELSHAILTGFANDNLHMSYVWGKNQLALNYNINWRNYNDNIQIENYDFSLSDNTFCYKQKNIGGFDYTTHNINMGYTHNSPDKFIFQIKFTPFYRTDNNNFESENRVDVNSDISLRKGEIDNHSQIFKPTLGAYSEIFISENKRIYADMVGTIYRTKQNNSETQYENTYSDNFALDNFLNAKTDKSSLITEIDYEQKFCKENTLDIGIKNNINRSEAEIKNVLNGGEPYKYNIKGSNQEAYIQYGQTINKFYYSIGLSGHHIHTENNEMDYDKFYFSPSFVFRYRINNKSNLSLRFRSYPKSPNISTMTKVANLLMDNVISYGNPNIEPSHIYSTRLNYSYNGKHFQCNFNPFFIRTNGEIAQYYSEGLFNGTPVIALKWENAKTYDELGINASVTWYPLKSRSLALNINYNYLHSVYQSNYAQKITHDYNGVFFNLQYRNETYGFNAYYRIPDKHFSPLYLTKDENNSGFDIFYNLKNWRFQASCMFMFNASSYSRETHSNLLMKEYWSSRIEDNKNMIVLGVSWIFNKGKSMKFKKVLNNNDGDGGIL